MCAMMDLLSSKVVQFPQNYLFVQELIIECCYAFIKTKSNVVQYFKCDAEKLLGEINLRRNVQLDYEAFCY